MWGANPHPLYQGAEKSAPLFLFGSPLRARTDEFFAFMVDLHNFDLDFLSILPIVFIL